MHSCHYVDAALLKRIDKEQPDDYEAVIIAPLLLCIRKKAGRGLQTMFSFALFSRNLLHLIEMRANSLLMCRRRAALQCRIRRERCALEKDIEQDKTEHQCGWFDSD